jgi:hypothetical protein
MAPVHELEPAEVEGGVLELKIDACSEVRVAVVADYAVSVANLE